MSMQPGFARRYSHAQDRQAWIDEFRLADLAPPVRDAVTVDAVAWPLAVQRAISAGMRTLEDLTDMVFFMLPGEIACRRRSAAGFQSSGRAERKMRFRRIVLDHPCGDLPEPSSIFNTDQKSC